MYCLSLYTIVLVLSKQASMGFCAPKTYSRLAVLAPSAAAARPLNLHVKYLCVHAPDLLVAPILPPTLTVQLCSAAVGSVTSGFLSNGSFAVRVNACQR
jgi:hypothetical protein